MARSKGDHWRERERERERLRAMKEISMRDHREHQWLPQGYFTVPISHSNQQLTAYGHTYGQQYVEPQWINTGNITVQQPQWEVIAAPSQPALPAAKESPLAWLDRRVNEICELASVR